MHLGGFDEVHLHLLDFADSGFLTRVGVFPHTVSDNFHVLLMQLAVLCLVPRGESAWL
jgi:hypothetical protein